MSARDIDAPEAIVLRQQMSEVIQSFRMVTKLFDRISTDLRRDVAMPGATQLDFYYFTWHWSAVRDPALH